MTPTKTPAEPILGSPDATGTANVVPSSLSGGVKVARSPRKRDLSEAQFRARLAKIGGELEAMGMLGYVTFPMPHGGRICINRHNAGERRRDQLRYLKRELAAHIKRDEQRRAKAVQS